MTERLHSVGILSLQHRGPRKGQPRCILIAKLICEALVGLQRVIKSATVLDLLTHPAIQDWVQQSAKPSTAYTTSAQHTLDGPSLSLCQALFGSELTRAVSTHM